MERTRERENSFVLLDKLEQMDVQSLQEFGEWLEVEGAFIVRW